jgi:branched-chain amino acid aminotransferase
MKEQEQKFHILNGKLVPESGLVVSARDLGFLRGYGIFDFLITFLGGKPFHLSDHLDRFYQSAEIIGIHIPWEKSLIKKWVYEALRANENGKEKSLRLMLTGGVSDDSVSPVQGEHPTFIVIVDSRHPCPKEWCQTGVGVITSNHTRYAPTAKSVNYIEGIRLINQARKQGDVEVIYYNGSQVYEGATSNIFALIEGLLQTPRSNILCGVTRDVVLKIQKLSVPVLEKDFTLDQLLSAQEVFLTASNKEILPVTKIDGRLVGSGKVGPVTKEMMKQFHEYVESGKWIE